MMRLVRIGLCAALLSPGGSNIAFAQGCVVCTRTGETQDPTFAKGLNKGILFLAFLPIGIISTVGVMWWRGRR